MIEERIDLSKCSMIRADDEIPGNLESTSLIGEYIIPGLKRTGFLKQNGCMMGASNDEDLREHLAANILENIGFPHADIILIYDSENEENACMSVNILQDNENFVDISRFKESQSYVTIQDLVNNDLKITSMLPNIQQQDIEERKDFIIQYLYISAILSNTDVKLENCKMIFNEKTKEYRNPEYYDSGVAFLTENDERTFFYGKNAEDIINELYTYYPAEILPIARIVEKILTDKKIDSILQSRVYNSFIPEIKARIKNELKSRIALSKKYSDDLIKYGKIKPYQISSEELADVEKNTDIGLRDRVYNFIGSLLSRSKER